MAQNAVTAMIAARELFRPANRVEIDLLDECVGVAFGPAGCGDLIAVVSDAERYWRTAGKAAQPRLWKSRATAAARLIARAELIAECSRIGIDPCIEIDGFEKLSAEQLRDELTFLGDYPV